MPNRLLAYCTPQSIVAGESVRLHASAPDPSRVDVTVTRVAASRAIADRVEGVAVDRHPLPTDVVASGCNWPAAAELATERDWPSGFYEVELAAVDGNGRALRTTAFFVVRPAPGTTRRILMPLSTNTWCAYNDFGGANLYTGATHASFERPLTAGILEKPPGAGRRVAVTHPPDPSQSSHVGYLILNGLTEWAGSAGWPNYEAPFLAWAERGGYEIDVCTNADLELHPEVVEGARLLLSVGRVEDGARTLVGYKQRFTEDPVYGTGDEALTTTLWSHPVTGRPEAALTGVSFTRGGYARIGTRVPRGSGGYVVQRPEHWLFGGTGLEYGDQLGADATVVGYERDGCDFTMVEGRPVPTGVGGTPASFEILTLASASPFDRASALRRVLTATGRSSSSTRSACSATTRPRPASDWPTATRCSAPTPPTAAPPW